MPRTKSLDQRTDLGGESCVNLTVAPTRDAPFPFISRQSNREGRDSGFDEVVSFETIRPPGAGKKSVWFGTESFVGPLVRQSRRCVRLLWGPAYPDGAAFMAFFFPNPRLTSERTRLIVAPSEGRIL